MHILALSFEYPPAQVGGLGKVIRDIYKEIWKYNEREDKKIYVSLAIPSNGLQNGFENIYIEKFETSFYVELSNKREKVDVLLARDKNNPSLPIHLICSNTLNNFKIYDNISEKIAIFSRAIPMFLDHLYWNGYGVDIIHSHDWHTGIAGIMSKLKYAKYGKDIKFIFTDHRIADKEAVYDVNFLDWIKFYEFDNISKAAYFSGYGFGKFSIEALSANYADKITSVSKSYLERDVIPFMLKFPFNSTNKFLYIFNGIEKSFIEDISVEEKHKIRKKFLNENGLSDGIMLSYVGRFDSRQGKPGVLLNAIEIFFNKYKEDVRFIIKYSGGDENLKNYAFYLQKKFPDKVKILTGWINLDNLYKATDIFVNVPNFEPFGLTTLEAMSKGAIIIGTETGGIRDMIIDFYWKFDFVENKISENFNGFFTLNDANALANKIYEVLFIIKARERAKNKEEYLNFLYSIPTEYSIIKEKLMKNPFLFDYMSKNSIERAGKFSIEETAKGYINLYLSIK